MKSLFTIVLMMAVALHGFTQSQNSSYICPPCDRECDNLTYNASGICSHCQMALIKKEESKTIAFYLQDGVEVLDFAGPLEVFSYAGYTVFTVSKTQDPIKAQGVLKVIPDYSIQNSPKADILAFFGGNASTAYQDQEVIDWIKKQKDTEYYFSVCTGAFLLAESGVLDGQTATTFHDALNNLEMNYPAIDVRKDVRFVDNGQVITTAGISAGIDGALHLVAKLQGLNEAKRTAYYMEYDNWIPGNGLILSPDDPYVFLNSNVGLKDYLGFYEYKDGSQLEIVLNDKSNDLSALIDGVKFPIYYEFQEVFSDRNGEPIFFERSEEGKVLGYRITKDGDLFSKIPN
jgi:putative intracellular protease/amidase